MLRKSKRWYTPWSARVNEVPGSGETPGGGVIGGRVDAVVVFIVEVGAAVTVTSVPVRVAEPEACR